MKTWQYCATIVRFRLRLWLINLGGIVALLALDLVPGQVMRRFFDWLTGEAQLSFGLSGLVALLLAVLVGRIISVITLMRTNTPFMWDNFALLRKNLLRHVLDAPGARALPSSAGEAISRFRDDVEMNVGTLV